jgi:hypothetical protein
MVLRVFLLLLLPFCLFGQVESKIHPGQIGAYGASNGSIMQLTSGVGSFVAPSTLQGSFLLPTGINGQTLYNISGTWAATSNLFNSGTGVGVGTQVTPDALNVNGSSSVNNRFLYRKESTNEIVGQFGSASNFNNGSVDDLGFRSSGKILFGNTASSNSQFIIDGSGNVGIGAILTPTYPLHYYKAVKDLRLGIYSDNSTGSPTVPNFMGIDFQGGGGYKFGSIVAVDRQQSYVYGGLAFIADPNVITPSQTIRMFIEGLNGNVGIGTGLTADAKLDVAGNFKLTTRTGTATSMAGWSSDNKSTDVQLSSEFSIDPSGIFKINTSGISSGMIADDAITTAKLLNSAVTNAKIADNAIGTSKIISGSVTGLKLAAGGANVGDFYAYGGAGVGYVPTTASGDITGPVSSLQIASGAVGAAEISSNAVTTVKIADNAVTSAKIVAQGVIPTSLQNPGGTSVTSIGSMPWWNGTAWIFGQNTQESFTLFTATGTVSASSSRRHSVFNPGSTQAAMTISLHPGGSPSPGQVVVCTFIDAVTALTIQSNGAAAVLGMPTSAAAGKTYTFKFIDTVGANGTWVLMQ